VRKWDISTVEGWTSVLRLTTRWRFRSIREEAMEQLEALASPSEKLRLAHELDVPKWVVPSLVTLCLRKAPLKLDEAEQLSMSDVVLIFTVRELIKDAKLPASMDSVSSHIRLLIDPQSATEQTAKETLVSKAEGRSNAETNVSQASDPSSPATTAFELDTLSSALRDYRFGPAAAAISGNDYKDTMCKINEWTQNGLGNRGENAVLDFGWAIIHRCARERAFIQPAIRIFTEWKRDTSNFSGSLDRLFQDFAYNGILNTPSEQAHCNPLTALGKALYGPQERWLSDEEFCLRWHNATTLVSELTRSGFLPLSVICDRLPADGGRAHVLYDCLLSLGPLLDIPGTKDKLSERLKACDNSVWNNAWNEKASGRKDHRVWMQVRRLIRIRSADLTIEPENLSSSRARLAAQGVGGEGVMYAIRSSLSSDI
jgi:hypothetical protein